MLVELVLNVLDRILLSKGIVFCRYADDYHFYCKNIDDAYKKLILISEIFMINDGLSLQKAKTRILESSEFIRSIENEIVNVGSDEEDDQNSETEHRSQLRVFLNIRLNFDPYSSTALEDYEELKKQLRKLDILGMLKVEIAKSRIHSAVVRRLVSAIRHSPKRVKNDAVKTLVDNLDILYPIYITVATTLRSVFHELDEVTKEYVLSSLRKRILEESHIFQVDLNLAYTVRIIGLKNTPDNESILTTIYNANSNVLIRKDIHLIMFNWKLYYWLTERKNYFATFSAWERRAFIVASYALGDEGRHWRRFQKKGFSPFELCIRDWAEAQSRGQNSEIPL